MPDIYHVGGQDSRRPLPPPQELDEPTVDGSDEFVPDVVAAADEFVPLHLPQEMPFSGVERLPLWDKWNAAALAKARDTMGPRPFERAFCQKPITDDEFVFPTAAVDAACDASLVLGQPPP